MSSAVEDRVGDLRAELTELIATTRSANTLTVAMQERVFEAVLLKAFTEFESFLEDLFFGLLVGEYQVDQVSPRVPIPDRDTARQLVQRTHERYLNWLPIDETIDRAERFLEHGKPFDRIAVRSDIKNKLKDAQVVRNATAHLSDNVKSKLDGVTSGRYSTAGEYLRAPAGGDTVCTDFIAGFVRFASGLTSPTPSVATFLGDSDALQSGRRAPRSATYRCDRCGSEGHFIEGTKLACSNCDSQCDQCGKKSSRGKLRSV